ncbi:two-component regulator propeller domain-containing protein [Niabella terrae]
MFGAFCLAAQDFPFEHYFLEDGLPSYSVLSITQDNTGFMWIGTSAGLCRFDGKRFKTYRADAFVAGGLSANNITSLYTDSHGRLWVGTIYTPNLYDSYNDRFIPIKINGTGLGNVFCFYEDSRGAVWIGTNTGLYKMNPRHPGTTVVFPVKGNHEGISGHLVRAISEDKSGQIWVGTENGLTRIRQRHDSLFQFISFRLDSTRTTAITALAWGSDGQLWIGTQNRGLYAFHPPSQRFTSFYSRPADPAGLINNNIRCISADRQQRLWIGTQEGISLLYPLTRRFVNLSHKASEDKSLSQNSIYSIYQDRNGSVWVGTYFGGLNFMPGYQTPFKKLHSTDQANSVSNNVISRILEDRQQNLWIGTEGGGVNFLNRKTGQYRHYEHRTTDPHSLGSNLVKEIFLDSENFLWVGTHGGGLNVLDKNRQIFTKYVIDSTDPPASEISSILEDEKGQLWVASHTGLRRFIKEHGKIRGTGPPLPPLPVIPSYLYKDRRGGIWLAGVNGLYKYQGHLFLEIDPNLVVYCFAEDAGGALWVGGNGLTRITGPDLSPLSQRATILQDYKFMGLLAEDSGAFWLSSDKGLIHYRPRNNSLHHYTQRDGLTGNGFNYNAYLKDSQGLFYFGGFNGISFFDPAEIKVNQRIPSLVFTGLKLQHQELGIGDKTGILHQNPISVSAISLRHDQNIFTIEFALLNYIKSSKHVYAYRLMGFDKNWNETPLPSATYTNLPPGNYRFLVKGANNDGFWSMPHELLITVSPPFWLTWWAYGIYMLFAAALIFMITRFFFMRALLKKEEQLHTAKLNFFTNVSHEIRTHLTLVMAPVERILTEAGENRFIQQQLIQVKRNTHRLLKLVGELMDFRKAESHHLAIHPRTQDLVAFLQLIYDSFRESAQARSIRCTYRHEKEQIAVDFDAQQLEKVFFNLLANALKFTPEGGHIELYACLRNDKAVVTVTDNGRGIAPPYIEKLFTNFFQVADHGLQNTGYGIGLALAKNIVTLHQGRIDVESTAATPQQEGTTVFTVTLPLSKLPLQAIADNFGKTVSGDKKAPELPQMPPAPAMPQEQGRAQLLIVEDNPEVAQLLQEGLGETFAVTVTGNGLQGWEYAINELPDLIISDVMMPEMDGYDFCNKIKTDRRSSHIPVILLTAKSSQKEQISGLQQGADLYLTKPFSMAVLRLSVQNLLAARERMRQQFSRELSHLNIQSTLDEHTLEPRSGAGIEKAFLSELSAQIDNCLDDPEFGVDMLSKKMAMSTPVLYKKVRALTHMSVNEFIKRQRFKKAAALILQKDHTINEVAYMVGYEDRKYFSREFKKYYGMLPREFAENPTLRDSP